jgi:uncharacterized protein
MTSKSATWVLITGPTSGIGYELARCFARDGYSLALCSRDAARLQAVADELAHEFGVASRVYPGDLSLAGTPEQLFADLERDQITVNILVNNAGYTVFGEFVSTPLDDEQAMIATNITALTTLTKLYLRQAPAHGERRILQLASTAAFQPGPLMAVYYATKAYVLSFSEALAVELADRGITVTALCPGITATNFAARGKMGRSKLVQNPLLIADARTVAEVGYRALHLGRTTEVVGTLNRLMAFSTRFAPRSLLARIVRGIQAPT